MLKEIKEELLKDQSSIVELLEYFDFEHIHLKNREIRFAREYKAGQNIRIRLENNDYLVVNDYSRGVRLDIFSYIIQEKNVTFREVIQQTKQILGLDDLWQPQKRKSLFGGIYDNISRKDRDIKLKIYDERILDQYEQCGNLRFLNDNISLEAQEFWGIKFSIMDNRIIIPIRNEYGELCGAKGRLNGNPEEEEPKYIYPIPVASSNVLYGYSENYSYLYGNDVIIVESEKSVMQGYSFGVRNIVALGSNNLSERQVKLLLQLQPKRIIIAMDEGLEFEYTKRNVDTIKSFSSIFTPEIWYWDSTIDLDIDFKASPTDMGKEKFEEIIKEQLVRLC